MPVLIATNRDKFQNLVDNYDKALGVERVGHDKEWTFIQMSEEDRDMLIRKTTDKPARQVINNLLGPHVESICQSIPKEMAYGEGAAFLAGTVLIDLGGLDNLTVFRDVRGPTGLIEWPVGDKVVPYLSKPMEVTWQTPKFTDPIADTKSQTPFLDQFMQDQSVNMQVALYTSRYGCTYALIGLHDSIGDVVESLDDHNGEGNYEVWGLSSSDSWYPCVAGNNMVDAVRRLDHFMQEHVAYWKELAWAIEKLGYGDIPGHGRLCPIQSIQELRDEYTRWNTEAGYEPQWLKE